MKTSVEAKPARSSASEKRSAKSTIITEDEAPVVQPAQAADTLPLLARAFLDNLLRLKLLNQNAERRFLEEHAQCLGQFSDALELGKALIKMGLLTQYQLKRVTAGTTHGLVLGNHKVLDRLGAGGMGVVFLAEHLFLNRQEAIKVLPVDEGYSPQQLDRFYTEMQVLAELRHPNIVAAYDAGQVSPPGPGLPTFLYLAMELVDGGDLEKRIHTHGPAPVSQACEWIRQAALGLQEAHDRSLIHRDIKPSNLLLDRKGQVKIVDFGLVRQFCKPLTRRGALLGSIDFMPPEQSVDSSAVGTGADIYGLGASLFWLLTGEPPYPRSRRMSEALSALQHTPPRTLRSLRPEAPPELETLLNSMLDRDPTHRPALPLTVSRALAALISSSRSA